MTRYDFVARRPISDGTGEASGKKCCTAPLHSVTVVLASIESHDAWDRCADER